MASGWDSAALQRRYMDALGGGKQAASQEQTAYQGLAGYDPYKAAATAAQGEWGQLYPEYKRGISDLVGSEVGRGRVRTGYGMTDEKRYTQDFSTRLANAMAANALQASSLGLQAKEGTFGAANNMYSRYLDLLSGGMDRATAADNAKRQEKSSLWGTLGGVVGTGLSIIPFL